MSVSADFQCVRMQGCETNLYILLIGILVLGIAAAGAVLLSPWPAVWLLRRGGEETVEAPETYRQQIQKIRQQTDLCYPSAYRKNRYDLYLPEGNQKAPLILWIHGGAFVAGDKSGVNTWASLLASEGYAVAAMNYEWAPEAVWPAQLLQIRDCLDAVKALPEAEDRIDMDRVFLAGDSAGAHMAAQAALLCFQEDFAERTGLSMPVKKPALKGLLLYCGPYEIEPFAMVENRALRFFANKIGQSYMGGIRWRKKRGTEFLDIARWMTGDCPPVYLTDGNSGSFERQGKRLGGRLRELGVPVMERYFEETEGSIPHEYQMQLTRPQAVTCYQDTLRFLSTYSPGQKWQEEGEEE